MSDVTESKATLQDMLERPQMQSQQQTVWRVTIGARSASGKIANYTLTDQKAFDALKQKMAEHETLAIISVVESLVINDPDGILKMLDGIDMEGEMRCAECDCENGGSDCNWIAAPNNDDEAVQAFAQAMTEKLAKKRSDGRGGWQDNDICNQDMLSQMLREHVEKGDPVDVANFAMMLHQRGEDIL